MVSRIVAQVVIALSIVCGSGCDGGASQPRPAMGFFITSVGLGDGGNLGGIEGADAHCQKLASAVGAGQRTWRAYLSAPATAGRPAINARDRIGTGPWFNAKGVAVANSVRGLHADGGALGFPNSVTESGATVPVNIHDMLTGSNPDGTLASVTPDLTCRGWTSDSVGLAMVGHYDRRGGGERPDSWNSAHRSAGCSAKALDSTGGAGLFYCFAVN
jgi:hypothetical protein